MKYFIFIGSLIVCVLAGCSNPNELKYKNPNRKIIFLHHSTGYLVWMGDKANMKRSYFKKTYYEVPQLLKDYHEKTGNRINIEEMNFPKGTTYPWQNDPYDYFNIWVKNSGASPYLDEPTLEMLTREYDIIIFKHCFPSSSILKDDSRIDINSDFKTLSNYKLQYNAIREKLHQFPNISFIVWTIPARVEIETNRDEAERAKVFTDWVKNDWDQKGDNITIFDFRQIETGGGLYLKPEYTRSVSDSHPNEILASKAAKLFAEVIIDVIENAID